MMPAYKNTSANAAGQRAGRDEPPAVLTPDTVIFVAGHRGMVGSAIARRLQTEGFGNLVVRTHRELDLTDQKSVEGFFQRHKVEYVVLAAAKVGGIAANSDYPADFIYQNLMIECNVVHCAYRAGVRRLLFLGSSCIYPKFAPQPLREESLLTGLLEPTNEWYAIAKIAGIKLCQAYNRQYGTSYRAVMPTNLYGPNDNYDLETSHVLPALIRKFHLAKMAAERNWPAIEADAARYGPIARAQLSDLRALAAYNGDPSGEPPAGVTLWGSGRPRREFLHVDDMADACVLLMGLPDRDLAAVLRTAANGAVAVDAKKVSPPAGGDDSVSHVNVGSGKDHTIAELAGVVQDVVGFRGRVAWDRDRPDGTPQKLLDVSRLRALGWQPRIELRKGIRATYEAYLQKR